MEELNILDGRPSYCPDCGVERLFVQVVGPEFCCTTCDAGLLIIDAEPIGDRNSDASTAA